VSWIAALNTFRESLGSGFQAGFRRNLRVPWAPVRWTVTI